jgi:glutaconate CoA-transferase subunit B
VDRFGNLNSTVIGKYGGPKIRLPGAGGATEIATSCGRVFIVMRQSPRAFVNRLDFMTTLGHGPTGRERRELGIMTEGPALLVTDLCIMKPGEETKEMTVVSLHPGVTMEAVRAATGWEVLAADRLAETMPPAATELEALRELNRRTAEAHGRHVAE